MTRARLLVTLPDGEWKADVSRRFPETTICVCASVLGADGGVELATVSGPAAPECAAAIERHPDAAATSSLDRRDEELTIQVETATDPILSAATESGVPVEYPVDVVDGEATVDVRGSHARLSALGEHLREAGLRFRVARVQRGHEGGGLLTDAQRELLLAAVEQGYYETPRRCTLTELADHVGLAKSTCSETLHRVEENLVEYFLTNGPAVERADRRAATA
ncbi:helix-turn-helix domain-containing protein [Halovivax sp.]|uniref:helix-turn-helix domain-containing protein n=1 Tax=Halovivax sp. TaxID=1935978 RepID=UPI0025BB0786|nr:helix-turn-helix domain-containing protein [Halovivax sp.]